MTNTELLNQFVSEISKDWTSNYKAEIVNNCLVVKTEVFDANNAPSWVDAGGINDKLVVFGEDEDVTSQLTYMIER